MCYYICILHEFKMPLLHLFMIILFFHFNLINFCHFLRPRYFLLVLYQILPSEHGNSIYRTPHDLVLTIFLFSSSPLDTLFSYTFNTFLCIHFQKFYFSFSFQNHRWVVFVLQFPHQVAYKKFIVIYVIITYLLPNKIVSNQPWPVFLCLILFIVINNFIMNYVVTDHFSVVWRCNYYIIDEHMFLSFRLHVTCDGREMSP